MKKLILTVILFVVCGCNELTLTQKAPLLVPNQQWVDKYGDDSQMEFNFAISRDIDSAVVRTMKKLHPADVNDPNNLMARIETLEMGIEKPDIKKMRVYDNTDYLCDYNYDVRDKLNEIIDRLNEVD